ncbi:MAG TPA: hypothetical protein VN030_03330 [Cellvibrio sp.]|nr:hypothetical protein [Cellvibrio sp.]
MSESSKQFELADATHVRVLETNILHASDVIYWLDASSANTVAAMSRIEHFLELNITQKPAAIKFLNAVGKTAFWMTPTQPMIAGVTTDAQRQRPAVAPFVIAGTVVDHTGRFNPAAFSLSLGSGNGSAVTLFPAAAAVRLSAGGAVQGHIAFAADEAPLVWGLLTLTVTVGLAETIQFRAQTDAKGDFVMPLKRLPPLPLSATEYSAELRIDGLAGASATVPINVADLETLELESSSVQNDFANIIPLTIRPGEIKRITSFNKTFIAVRTA